MLQETRLVKGVYILSSTNVTIYILTYTYLLTYGTWTTVTSIFGFLALFLLELMKVT